MMIRGKHTMALWLALGQQKEETRLPVDQALGILKKLRVKAEAERQQQLSDGEACERCAAEGCLKCATIACDVWAH